MADMTNNRKTLRIKPDGSGYTVAAGTTDVNTDAVDTTGYEGVRFIIGWGTITSSAVTSVKAQEDTTTAMSTAQDIASSSVTVADTDDNKLTIYDIYRPRKSCVRLAIDRGTANAVIDFCIVELYGGRLSPRTADTTVQGSKIMSSPAEGTA